MFQLLAENEDLAEDEYEGDEDDTEAALAEFDFLGPEGE